MGRRQNSDKKMAGIKRVTSIDVARYAGVSQSTVSRALSSDIKLPPETREKVMTAVRKLGYKPNAIARSLTSQHTNIIGIAMSNISSPFYSYVLNGFTKRLLEAGKQVLLFCTDTDNEIDEMLSTVLQYRLDGLIIASATITSIMADECMSNGTAVILFNRYVPGAKASAVSCDNVEGGRIVANLLVDAGFKRIAYISGKENSSTNVDRKKGFTDRLYERGIISCMIEKGEYSYESGAQAARKLFSREDPPEAIFCANDIIALGAMDALRYEMGIRIPEDVSIIGFDDILMASWPSYSLTTIRQPVEEMMDHAIKLLFERMNTPDVEPTLQLFEAKLVRRGSAKLSE